MIGLILSLQAYAATISAAIGTNDALYTAVQSASGDTLILQRGMYQECVNTLAKTWFSVGKMALR